MIPHPPHEGGRTTQPPTATAADRRQEHDVPLLPGAEPYSHDAGPGSVGVLVIHGFTGSPKSMRPWAEELARSGLSVELPRLPGHGTQWQDMAVTRWEDWYAEVDRSFGTLPSASRRTGQARSRAWSW
jgi:alpha-beta hydrolase superfamily lysophospholipase